MAGKAKEKAAINRKTIWLGYLTDKPRGPNYNRVCNFSKKFLMTLSDGLIRLCRRLS